MGHDLLTALSVGLLPISAINFVQAIRFQIARVAEQGRKDISYFVWGLLCWQLAIFASSVLYLLWDFDVIAKATQYQLSVLPRSFFVAGSIFFYHGLNISGDEEVKRNFVVILIIAVIIVAFCTGVLL